MVYITPGPLVVTLGTTTPFFLIVTFISTLKMQATVFTDNNAATFAKRPRKLRKLVADIIGIILVIAIPETSAMALTSQPEVMGDTFVISEPVGTIDKIGMLGLIEEIANILPDPLKGLNGEIVNTEVTVKRVTFGNTVQGVIFVNVHTTVDKLFLRHRQHTRLSPENRLKVLKHCIRQNPILHYDRHRHLLVVLEHLG
jgi:hypothetical protein